MMPTLTNEQIARAFDRALKPRKTTEERIERHLAVLKWLCAIQVIMTALVLVALGRLFS